MMEQDNQEAEEIGLSIVRLHKGDLAYWADAAFMTERVRIAAWNRIVALRKVGTSSSDLEKFLEVAKAAEAFADGRLAAHIVQHPTWDWARRISGVGKEVYPKVIGLVESFGRFYDVGDLMIPAFVTREPEEYKKIELGKVVDRIGIWVAGIERLQTPSKLFKYEGLDVDERTGKAPRRAAGEKRPFNWDLRTALFRLARSLLMAEGLWYQHEYHGYVGKREHLTQKAEERGVKIVPTPKERMCINCNLVVVRKKAKYCPECEGPLSLKEEPPGVLYLGHLHQQAVRLMLKDFSLCMWLVWRQALGLPITQPYSVTFCGHKPIDPWEMVDRRP